MGVGEGGRVGDRPPPNFHDEVLGAPVTLKKGPLITCKKKAVLLFFEANGAKKKNNKMAS